MSSTTDTMKRFAKYNKPNTKTSIIDNKAVIENTVMSDDDIIKILDKQDVTLIFDVHNLVYITAYGLKKNIASNELITVEDIVRNYIAKTMHLTNSLFNNPVRLVHSFESGTNWRYKYTESNDLMVYKSNRGKSTDELKPIIKSAVKILKQLFDEYSTHYAISVDKFEGDDVVSAVVDLVDDSYKVILSTDEDFIQLTDNNAFVFSIMKQKFLQHEDLNYFLFEKCIRGDSGDGVKSAYPRVRSTRIKEAYNDNIKQVAFMNETWQDPASGKLNIVKEQFDHNIKLMNLRKQPNRDILMNNVKGELQKDKKPNVVNLLQLVAEFFPEEGNRKRVISFLNKSLK